MATAKARCDVLLRMQRLCRVLQALAAIALALFGIAFALHTITPLINGWTAETALSIDRTSHTTTLAQWVSLETTFALVVLMLWRAYSVLHRIVRTKDPFRPTVARDLRVIAVALVLFWFLPSLVSLVAARILGSFFEGIAFQGQALPLSSLIVGLLMFVFAYVVEYGCILQSQDDGLV